MTDISLALVAMVLLGAFHGLNPGMGWLFAVALGLQERRRGAVWSSLIPLALGHALAIAIAVAVLLLIGDVLPERPLKWLVAATLLVFAATRVIRQRHPRYGGMQVGPRQLAIWSFLMATAHGAGLMVLPFLVDARPVPVFGDETDPKVEQMHHLRPAMLTSADPVDAGADHSSHSHHAHHASVVAAAGPSTPAFGLLATLVHTLGYLLVMGVCAVIVYEKLGLRLLNRAWVNLDLVWIAALVVTAGFTLLM